MDNEQQKVKEVDTRNWQEHEEAILPISRKERMKKWREGDRGVKNIKFYMMLF